MQTTYQSQSLFIQGWGTTAAGRGVETGDFVSIPFHSGLGYYSSSFERSQALSRLNPFSFRAGVLQIKRSNKS